VTGERSGLSRFSNIFGLHSLTVFMFSPVGVFLWCSVENLTQRSPSALILSSEYPQQRSRCSCPGLMPSCSSKQCLEFSSLIISELTYLVKLLSLSSSVSATAQVGLLPVPTALSCFCYFWRMTEFFVVQKGKFVSFFLKELIDTLLNAVPPKPVWWPSQFFWHFRHSLATYIYFLKRSPKWIIRKCTATLF